MSTVITANERLARVKEHILAATKDMSAIVIDGCEGCDAIQANHMASLHNILTNLIGLKSNMNCIARAAE